MNPVPAGVRGEIYIAAPHLARGYLQCPDLTAERFVPDPFAGSYGGRLYRTGDLGRYLSNGEIEFLGRSDDQVKIRCFRIELGEIETALQNHEHVRHAAVAVRQIEAHERLVAYIVARPDAQPRISELRHHAGQYLPDHMVPSAFVFLDQLPLLHNGKVDRRSLPTPDVRRPEIDTKYEQPRNHVESTIAEIWASFLGIETVGTHDNFLELGGDSLRATQMALQIEDRLGIEVPVHLLFERPTVAELAMEISSLLNT